MPKINWGNVDESTGDGGFRTPEPGGYVCRIITIEPHDDRQYVMAYWDIAEGEYKGCYADSQWPPRDVMSYKPTALPITKHKLHVLTDANPGFDAQAAFDTDNWAAFAGKVFGAVLRKTMYTKRDGSDGEGIEVGTWKRPDEIRAGAWKPMAPRDTRERKPEPKPAQSSYDSAASVYDDDLPWG